MTRFVRNPSFERQMGREVGYRAQLKLQTETAAKAVREAAPVETGDYRASIETYEDGLEVGVTTTDFAGHIVEWGSVNSPPYAPLRRGVRAAGMRLQEQ